MQLFPCPFCGPRPETEFHYQGEADTARPDEDGVPAERWADYLYMRDNRRGPGREVWVHLCCSEFFVMERDSLTHAVPVPGERAQAI